MRKLIALSIVSHGQGSLVERLLADLVAHVNESVEVIVTVNVPEPEAYLERAPFPVKVLRNERPRGFGSNHNQAFASADADYFAVLNPDLRLPSLDLDCLIAVFGDASVGAVSPLVKGPAGTVEDNARRFPSPLRIVRRALRRLRGIANTSDYDVAAGRQTCVEWVAGMFVVFPSALYRRVGGFDERFFMYLEDADICRRLAHEGYRTVVEGRTSVVHDARRATLVRADHLAWHLRSMARFFAKSLALRLASARGRAATRVRIK